MGHRVQRRHVRGSWWRAPAGPGRGGAALFALVVSLFGPACGGSRGPAGLDGSPASDADGGPTGPIDAPADLGADRPADRSDVPGDTPREASPDLGSQELPVGVAPPRLVVPGDLVLVGEGPSACSHQSPTAGSGGPGSPTARADRWCAFKRPIKDAGTELWAFNVSKALGGAPPVCDGTSADCLRLSTSLWIQSPLAGPQQRYANRFEGDTLFIHDQARSTGEAAFEGAISVWRPGWARPRQLSAGANACYGDPRHPLAFCLDAVRHEGFIPVEFDLRAGSIADPAGGGLPLVERVRLLRADGEPSVHATFTADGQSFVYSAPAAPGAAAAPLYLVKVADLGTGTATTILPDVMDWEIAKDGRALFFITDYVKGGGIFNVVDFPSAANPRALPDRVNGYVVLGGETDQERGLGIFSPLPGGGLEYRIVPDRAALERQVKVFAYRTALESFRESPDQRFTGYTKPENGERGFIARSDGSGECLLSPERGRPPYDFAFLPGGGLVFWVEPSEDDPDDTFDGWMADPATCEGRQRFAARIAFHMPLGDRGLLFADEFDLSVGTATLKYAAITDGRGWPAAGQGPVRIRAGVDFPVTLVGPERGHVLFQVSRGPEGERGLYVFPLPATLR